MLVQLHIKDMAIIDSVDLELGPGFNVLTGETGAGKSIIVEAASLLRGGRSNKEMVRKGCEQASVEALFDLSSSPELARELQETGLPMDGNEVLVRRIIPRSGRGKVYVNGSICTAALLGKISKQLLDISGQHEHQMLSNVSTHLKILDSWGGATKQLSRMNKVYRELVEHARKLAQSQMDDRQRAERIDFLAFQLRELEAAHLEAGEEDEQEKEYRRQVQVADLMEASREGERELYGGDRSVVDRLSQNIQRLEGLIDADAELESLSRQLVEARVLVEDVALSLRRYAAGLDLDPGRLAQVEQRLDLIRRLQRKHGGSVQEILEKKAMMEHELVQLETMDEVRDALRIQLEAARDRARKAAVALTRTRRRAARRLSADVTSELAWLGMEGASMEVEISNREPRSGDDEALRLGDRAVGSSGWDRVEFRIAANPGEGALPLHRVASGGELSRVMLALRKGLGRHVPVHTSVYDEVDAGISGLVADLVGRSLFQISRHRQVLCVTHLPQVAAHADIQFHVGKTTRGRRTRTTIARLGTRARVEELARMLGGEKVSAQARANARQLITAAGPGRAESAEPEG